MPVVISDARRFVFTVVIVGLVMPVLVFWTRLPDPIATLWSGTAPSGSMPRWLFLVLVPIVWCIAWSGLVLGADLHPWADMVMYLCGGLLLAVVVVTVHANFDVRGWTEADLAVGSAVAAFVGAEALTVAVGVLARRSADRKSPEPSHVNG